MKRDKEIRRRCLRDKPNCSRCYVAVRLVVHHIVALADGGSDTLDNVDTLCHNCHREWHDSYEIATPYEEFLDIPSIGFHKAASLLGLDLTASELKARFASMKAYPGSKELFRELHHLFKKEAEFVATVLCDKGVKVEFAG